MKHLQFLQLNRQIIVLIICLLPSFNYAQSSDIESSSVQINSDRNSTILKQLEIYALSVKQDWNIPGMAISIVKDGELIYAKGFGVKDISKSSTDSNNIIDENTVFQIGSVSKSFTAAVIASLVDEGKIKWEDTVKKILPDFRMYDKWVEENIQIKDIMTHHTGIKGQMGTYIPNMGYSREDVYKMIALMKPKYSFRGGYEYNNITFLIAQRIIEKITGKSWEENVKERIFNPLKMEYSSLNEEGFVSSPNVSIPHDTGYLLKKNSFPDSLAISNKSFLPEIDSCYVSPLYGQEQALHWLTVIGPAGSVNSTVSDLAKYTQFQLNKGKVPASGFFQDTNSLIQKDIISGKNMDYIHRGQTITSQDSSRTTLYGQCWFIEQNNRYRLYFHTGTTWGFTALVAFVPELNLGMSILVNSEASASPRYAIMRRLIDLYLQKENDKILRDYNKEYLADWAQMGRESAVKANKKREQVIDNSNKKEDIVLDPITITGVYDKGSLFGKISISRENDSLYITAGPLGWKNTLNHKSGTKFSFRSQGHEFPVTFLYETKKLFLRKKSYKKIIGLEIDFGYGEDFGVWKKAE